MGWTDDLDTEGLVEENPFIFIIIGVIGAVAVSILYLVGIDYYPGWFEGQNLISTMGIIFLIIFIPATAISTLTGRSDLVKWEAIFLILSFLMVYLGNNDIINAFGAKIGSWLNIDWNVKDLISIVLIIAIIATAISAAFGKGVSFGSAAIFAICIVALWAINSGWSWDNFFEKIGSAIHNATSGIVGADIGTSLGIGILGAAAIILIGTGIGAPIGLGALAAIGFAIGFGGSILWQNML